jgi:predicted SprT family Zn-dependent metalloprotease
MSPEDLRARLEADLGEPVDLVLTENRTSVLTFSREAGRVRMRLQRAFLEAPEEVLRAIASFVRQPRRSARDALIRYFDSRPEAPRRPRPAPRAERAPNACGRTHDLRAIFEALNERHFGGAIRSAIGWGEPGRAASGRRGGRSIRFGAYFRERDLIRIHPALDAEWVPRFFVEAIVYHEMLHAAIPVETGPDGRRVIHSPEFRRRERQLFAWREARRWERENLRRLLAARG